MDTAIIVNADDLGLGPAVNRAVFDGMERGRVSSATILANGPAVEEAVRTARAFPHCSFGAHLNITEFRPLTGDPRLRPLLDSSGCFTGAARHTRFAAPMREAIFEEWCAQVARLRGLGLAVSHLDSHDQVHTQPALFLVLKRVQRRFGIRKVRISRNIFGPGERPHPAKTAAKGAWNAALRHLYATRTTDRFAPFDVFHSCLAEGRRFAGTIELMVHPGHPAHEGETARLGGGWLAELGPGARLVGYGRL